MRCVSARLLSVVHCRDDPAEMINLDPPPPGKDVNKVKPKATQVTVIPTNS